jgi:hypothetical protein
VAWVVLSVIVSLAGPFGSYDALSLPTRALFWSVTLGAGIVIGAAIRAFVHGVLGIRDFLRGSGLIAVLVTLLFTPPLSFIASWLFPLGAGRAPSLVEIAVFIFFVSYGVGAFRHALWESEKRRLAVANHEDATQPLPPRLFLRIAPAIHGQLWLISVRDHYVDVLTDLGQASLLMRFSDAVAEAHPVPGAQVHRSYWVAWEAVAQAERDGAKVYLHLANGQRVPVSRNYRGKLEERGLL